MTQSKKVLDKAEKTNITNIWEMDKMAVFNSDKKTPVKVAGDTVTYQIDFTKENKDYTRYFEIDYGAIKTLPLDQQALLVKKMIGDARNNFASALKTEKEEKDYIKNTVQSLINQELRVQKEIVDKIVKSWK